MNRLLKLSIYTVVAIFLSGIAVGCSGDDLVLDHNGGGDDDIEIILLENQQETVEGA